MIIQLNPKHAQAYSYKCECLIQLKNHTGAIDASNKAIEIDPTNSIYKNLKATILVKSKIYFISFCLFNLN